MEVRDQRRQKRADARAGRRNGGQDTVDRMKDAVSDNVGGVDLKRAATTAAAAALVGGLAGALKAFADRHDRSSEPERDEAPTPEQAEREEPQREEPSDELDDQFDDEAADESDGEDSDGEPSDATEQASDEQRPEERAEQEEHDDQEQRQQPTPTGAASNDVAKVISRARQHVKQVLGADPEGVSGVERSNGNWAVSVEVVKLRRIPDSTDILASYAVVVDGDGDLVSLNEIRRYRRSQSEEDR